MGGYAPAHTARMAWRTQWIDSMPKRRAFANLAAFYPALVDFADADGRNLGKGRSFVSQARLADNVRCDPKTIPVLYDAAEAAGLIVTTRTPMGTVNGYGLRLDLLLTGSDPDWDAALDALENGMREAKRSGQSAGFSSSRSGGNAGSSSSAGRAASKSGGNAGSSGPRPDQRSGGLGTQRSGGLGTKDPAGTPDNQEDHGLNHEGDAVVTSSYGDDDLAARRAAEIRAQIRRRARA